MKQWYRLLAAGLALALLTGCAGGAAPSGQEFLLCLHFPYKICLGLLDLK